MATLPVLRIPPAPSSPGVWSSPELRATYGSGGGSVTANGRPPLPLERKQKLGTLRPGRLPEAGLTEVERLPEEEGVPEPPAQLKAKGREFWSSVFANGGWLWKEVDRHLVELTAHLMDERQELRELTDQQPDKHSPKSSAPAIRQATSYQSGCTGLHTFGKVALGVSASKNTEQGPGVVGA